MSFSFFTRDRPSRYTVFFKWNFYFFKNKASVAFSGSTICFLKWPIFWELQHSEDLIKSLFICIPAMQNGYLFIQKKLDLSMYCMRGVTELSKSTNFSCTCMYEKQLVKFTKNMPNFALYIKSFSCIFHEIKLWTGWESVNNIYFKCIYIFTEQNTWQLFKIGKVKGTC
jgi:hypothetical protein